MRVLLGSLRREPPRPDELTNERVVVGQLFEHIALEHVSPRVADMADRNCPGDLVDEKRGHGRPHPCDQRIAERALVDLLVGLRDQRHEHVLTLATWPARAESRCGEP